MRGQRELPTGIARNFRLIVPGARDEYVRLPQPFETDDFAAEHERIADLQLGDEHLVDLAEHAPAGEPRSMPWRRSTFATDEPHLQHRRIDDCAGIHAVLLGDTRVCNPQASVSCGAEACEAFIRAQRIAA